MWCLHEKESYYYPSKGCARNSVWVVPRVIGSKPGTNASITLGAPLVLQDSIVSADATHSCEARMCELTRIASRSAGAAARGRERGPRRVHPPTTIGAVKVELRLRLLEAPTACVLRGRPGGASHGAGLSQFALPGDALTHRPTRLLACGA